MLGTDAYLWVDWMCMPQPGAPAVSGLYEPPSSDKAKADLISDSSFAIQSIAAYVEMSSFVLVLVGLYYLSPQHIDMYIK